MHQYLEMKCHDACKLLSNSSEKKNVSIHPLSSAIMLAEFVPEPT